MTFSTVSQRPPINGDDRTDAEWQISVPNDGRKIGVIVHHVASVYLLEIQLAQAPAAASRLLA